MLKILTTGGMGYIGSHTVIALLESGHEVVILDNLSNANIEVLARLKKITGRDVPFIEGDVRNRELLAQTLARYGFDAVIHFAGLKAVGESVAEPMKYYDNNVNGSLILMQEMAKAGVFQLVFSSSATVYGDSKVVPLTESAEAGKTTNPYGASKYMVECMMRDIAQADERWSMVVLRYFNPVGAHESGLIGEAPNGTPNNLLPYICQVAVGKREFLSVFGGDYPTPDGTGVRDYIHVTDLADGHVKAVQTHQHGGGFHIYNLGTGIGYSVLEMVKALEQAAQVKVGYQIVPRRPGDIAVCYADATLAKQILGWQAQCGLEKMMQDSWRWQSQNPNGYDV
ncbi:UDP-glucose 4-epimerase GalE [Vitreoscilla stercoraria]|uniref:UDP-glucose 4-epimerase n=1 Tax=Vitreoscilla stercoraria TaxID=61 RepID=A0ABY4EFQ7_VITST|nr:MULTISPECIES: UDP-glucose 4-epimerase GalE [Vitreoscilla]UOO93735.1 UDP-glucose 4-epimerase GalE [Vitreoscilla stercoraria]